MRLRLALPSQQQGRQQHHGGAMRLRLALPSQQQGRQQHKRVLVSLPPHGAAVGCFGVMPKTPCEEGTRHHERGALRVALVQTLELTRLRRRQASATLTNEQDRGMLEWISDMEGSLSMLDRLPLSHKVCCPVEQNRRKLSLPVPPPPSPPPPSPPPPSP